MSDPFILPNSEAQLIREAKIGFSLVFFVVFALGCWSIHQYQNLQNQIPDHVRNAPVARHVGPEEYLRHLDAPTSESSASGVMVVATSHSEPEPAVSSGRMAKNDLTAARPRPGDAVKKRPVSDAFDFDKSIDTGLEIQRLNDNLDQLSKIANTLATYDRPSKPPEIIAQSLNPVERPAARDMSIDLARFPRAEKIDRTPAGPLPNELAGPTGVDPQPDVPSLFQSPATQRNDQVERVSFEENKLSQPAAEDDNPGSSDGRNPTTSDEEITLEVVDPEPLTVVPSSLHETASDDDKFHYRTVNGDSFYSIAQQIYGDGRYFSALFEHNRQAVENYDVLPTDSRIKTPPLEDLRRQYPQLCPKLPSTSGADGKKYTTVEGDTLFHIARQTTGQASRYVELLNLNRDRLPIGANHLTRLQANLELRLPH